MNWAERCSNAIVDYSRPIVAVMVLLTVVVGAGAGAIEQTSSLDQFQSDSVEADKQAYIDENFSVGGANTTSAQVIVRDENVLEQETLVETLRLQQAFREDERINRTLAEDQPTVGVANVVAQRAILGEEAEGLEDRANQLENESEALEAAFRELQNESQALENESEALEAEGEQLQAQRRSLTFQADQLERDRANLERRTGILQSALEETASLQGEYEQLNRSYAAGEVNDTEYAAESERIENEIDATLANATETADLDAQQAAQFRNAAGQVRSLTSQQSQLEVELQTLQAEREQAFEAGVSVDPANASVLSGALNETIELQTEYDQLNRSYAAGNVSDSEYAQESQRIETGIEEAQTEAIAAADLDDQQAANFTAAADTVRDRTSEINRVRAEQAQVGEQLEGAFEAGTAGVFAEAFADLQDRGQELEARGERLAERGEQLQQRREELEQRGEELQQRREELEAWRTELEERGQQLENESATLQDREAPTLAEQIDELSSMNDSEFESALEDVLGEDADERTGGLSFMPTSYELGSTSANATMFLVTHDTGSSDGAQAGTASQNLTDAQLAMQSIANERAAAGGSDVVVFGGGIMSEEIDNSMGDSLAIVGPLALLFVIVALLIAYRDVLDILLGLFGIAAVLLWTFGFMGWTGIDFNQIFIAVPVLLIGLSIDYAIHIFMRHREQRQGDEQGAYDGGDASGSMKVALAGVGVALVWVTATTVIGFLANLTSPVPPIQDFGLVSAAGITFALLVFGVFVPAVKVELDEFFEARGFDRTKRAFGTGGGRLSRAIASGATVARRAPIAVLVVAILVSAGGAYGATQVDTSFDQEDFIAEDPPDWTKNLPEPFAPGDYQMKENLEYVNQHFVREDSQAQILVEDDVATPEALQRLSEAERRAADSEVVVTLSNGEADVQSPLRTMEDVAAQNESFNESFVAADTDGDDVPDQDVEALYDELFEVAPDEAAGVIHRTDDGEYRAVRLVVSTSGTASMSDVTDEMRAIAADLDGDGLEATATGQTILFDIVQEQLLDTVIESLLITLVAVFGFLMLTYRITEGSASLGAVTLLPVVFSVTWILGTMYLAGIPFNVMTGMITSLTVGLGVAYSIHVSERYNLELERTGSVWEAMERTVTGTGGALLGSAATTIGGFGVLAFAILPPLQQFGIITGMTIFYAFLASVLVLPSLLVLWTRYFGPDVSFEAPTGSSSGAAVSDGGAEPSDDRP